MPTKYLTSEEEIIKYIILNETTEDELIEYFGFKPTLIKINDVFSYTLIKKKKMNLKLTESLI